MGIYCNNPCTILIGNNGISSFVLVTPADFTVRLNFFFAGFLIVQDNVINILESEPGVYNSLCKSQIR